MLRSTRPIHFTANRQPAFINHRRGAYMSTNRQILAPANKHTVYDMHSEAKIGEYNSKDDAMEAVIKDLKKDDNLGRCYTVYEGEKEAKKEPVWFGDSWDIGAYLRKKNAPAAEQMEMNANNIMRIPGISFYLQPKVQSTDEAEKKNVGLTKKS